MLFRSPVPPAPIPIIEVKPETRPDPDPELLVVIPIESIVVPEPEPVIAVVEPEPEPEPIITIIEPDPIIAVIEPEPEPEPEPIIAVIEPEPEPEPLIVITEPDPDPAITPSAPLHGYTLVPAEERPPTGISGTAVRDGTAGVPQLFSVPAIAELERGRYYLQIGAFSQVSAVEQELSKVGRGYPLTIQSIGTTTLPVYRILVGPVNQGESGALLRTFQSQGYRDAFIRRGE